MATPKLPTSVTAAKKPGRKPGRKPGQGRKPSFAKRLGGTARVKQLTDTAITFGTILGSGSAASFAAGYRGDKGLKVGPVDGRLAAGLGAMIFGLWDVKKTNVHAVNAGLGILGSWMHEQSFEMGGKWASKGGATTTSAGFVVGDVDEDDSEGLEVGGAKSRARRLARIEKRIQRLRARRQRIAAKAGTRALPAPGAGNLVTVPAWAVRPQYAQAMR